MDFRRINEHDIRVLENMVTKERLSNGISNLKLHSSDQSHHKPCFPELIIWPVEEKEVSEILGYANKNMIPVTAWGSGTSLHTPPASFQSGCQSIVNLIDCLREIGEREAKHEVC